MIARWPIRMLLNILWNSSLSWSRYCSIVLKVVLGNNWHPVNNLFLCHCIINPTLLIDGRRGAIIRKKAYKYIVRTLAALCGTQVVVGPQ